LEKLQVKKNQGSFLRGVNRFSILARKHKCFLIANLEKLQVKKNLGSFLRGVNRFSTKILEKLQVKRVNTP